MAYTQRQEAIYATLLQGADPHYWHDPSIAPDMAAFLGDPFRLGPLLNAARKQQIDTFQLKAGWEQAQHMNGEIEAAIAASFPYVAPPLMPALPNTARLDPSLAEGAAPWLEAYCQHSRWWAPRAAQGFHQAVGLWMLSTIAARRICVHLGKPEFPMLFLAMIAPSTLYTKTTTAHIARRGLKQTGCHFFLTPDRITPQALIRRMSGRVHEEFAGFDDLDREMHVRDLAFAGQRGWYYEEWGTMLGQMRRQDSAMAEFHGMLRVLDDGTDDFSNETILRGLESVVDPSLALLCSATAADLAPYMRPGAPWWRDGFWPRFAFITPHIDEAPSLADQPTGLDDLPTAMVRQLHDWHSRLGQPACRVEPVKDDAGKSTGKWRVVRPPFAPQVLAVETDVLAAYRAYNNALLTLVIENKVEADLSACYGRLHAKALRVAMLLASVQDCRQIELCHWAYAQQVTESWRAMLHSLIAVAASTEAMTREQLWEEKIENLLSSCGAMTARDLQRNLFRCTAHELKNLLGAMVSIGRIILIPKGRTNLYMLPLDAPPLEEGGHDAA
jgi:hypothetical protein